MADIQKFINLEIWQKARTRCRDIFFLLSSGIFVKDKSLTDLVYRSGGFILNNRTVGFGRNGKIVFINFLTYTNASAHVPKKVTTHESPTTN